MTLITRIIETEGNEGTKILPKNVWTPSFVFLVVFCFEFCLRSRFVGALSGRAYQIYAGVISLRPIAENEDRCGSGPTPDRVAAAPA
jgi:hypothetical protein